MGYLYLSADLLHAAVTSCRSLRNSWVEKRSRVLVLFFIGCFVVLFLLIAPVSFRAVLRKTIADKSKYSFHAKYYLASTVELDGKVCIATHDIYMYAAV